ncbi:MAG: hypothetical protein JRN50_02340 [Nitrososphaerota archaeon]|nr:hypothetical protein [Nitrososphaerota archaeon]
MDAATFEPHFRQALAEFALAQQGAMMNITVHNLLAFMQRKGYPMLENEGSMRNLTNAFLSDFFGPTWDGAKYRKLRNGDGNSSKGRSLLIGTDNVLDSLRYRGVVA